MSIDPQVWEQRLPGALRRLRLARELSQEEAAEMAEISAVTLSKWERGLAMPQFGLLVKLLAILDYDLVTLQEAVETERLGSHRARRRRRRTSPLPAPQKRVLADGVNGDDGRDLPTDGPDVQGRMHEGGLIVWWATEQVGDMAPDEEVMEDTLGRLRDSVYRQVYRRHAGSSTGPRGRALEVSEDGSSPPAEAANPEGDG